jgi:hypothetical protein
MNALLLDGSLPGDVQLGEVQHALAGELGTRGHTTRTLVLREAPIAYCQGCFDCWVRSPGLCRTDDAGRDVARAFIQSDVVVFLTPVTFGGYSSELKKAIDRLICLVSPFFTRVQGEVHHQMRYGSYPRLLAIGVLPEPCAEEESVFHALVRRNAINMHAPWHASRTVYRSLAADAVAAVLRAAVLDMERAA